MKTVKGVKKYAKQFLSAVEMSAAPQAIEQLQALADLMERDRTFRNLFVGPLLGEAERKQVIEHLGRKLGMTDTTVKFLQYLAASQALGSLAEIAAAAVAQYLEMKRRARAVVTSAAPLSREYETKLAAALKQVTGRDVELDYVIDPALLGGVRVKVGSTMYDSSIRGQLGLLKDKLIKG